MQPPTCTSIRIRHVRDAHLLFHAARSGILPIVTRRLDTEERRAVRPGNVYVWEERGPNSRATGLGIERWTDGIPWSASRVRDEFLFYHQRQTSTDADYYGEANDTGSGANNQYRLVKQTYSVLVDTSAGQRKWHLTAYFVPATVDQLRTVDDLPGVANLHVPDGLYVSAKVGKGRARDCWTSGGEDEPGPSPRLESAPAAYPTYAPFSSIQQSQRALQGQTSFQAPVWPDHARTGSRPSPALEPRAPDTGRPFQALPPLPLQPATSNYSPRHPLDAAALRSLRGVM